MDDEVVEAAIEGAHEVVEAAIEGAHQVTPADSRRRACRASLAGCPDRLH
jgi:hypothetical protein